MPGKFGKEYILVGCSMSFDLVYKQIGELGLYQKYILFLGWLTDVYGGLVFMNSFFLLYIPDHRCAIPGYENDSYDVQNDAHQILINKTIPLSSDGNSLYDQCHLFQPTENNQTVDSLSNKTLVKCSSWVYDSSIYSVTLGTKLNLVCDKAILKSSAQMAFFTGYLIGSFASGIVSDRFGRKSTFYGSVIILTINCISIAWTPRIEVYLIQNALVGCCYVGMFLPIYCIGMEFVGPSKRLYAGQLISCFWVSGCLTMVGIAYMIRDWSVYQIVCAAPGVLLWSYWLFYPESPRWLYTQGRTEEMKKILMKAASVNKSEISDDFFDNLPRPEKEDSYVAFFKYFRHKVFAIRAMVLYFNWFAVCLAYYGLALNSDSLGSKYGLHLYFFLQMLMDAPAIFTVLFLVDKIGRKSVLIGCMLIGGIVCIACTFTIVYGGKDGTIATVILALIGKFASATGFNAAYQLSVETFPTVARNAGLGSCSCMARIGGIIAPLIADLDRLVGGKFGKGLPMLIFGVLSVVAGLMAFILPETLKRNLTETIQEELEVDRKMAYSNRSKSMSDKDERNVRKPLNKDGTRDKSLELANEKSDTPF